MHLTNNVLHEVKVGGMWVYTQNGCLKVRIKADEMEVSL